MMQWDKYMTEENTSVNSLPVLGSSNLVARQNHWISFFLILLQKDVKHADTLEDMWP